MEMFTEINIIYLIYFINCQLASVLFNEFKFRISESVLFNTFNSFNI